MLQVKTVLTAAALISSAFLSSAHAACPVNRDGRAVLELQGQRYTGRNTLYLRQLLNLDQRCTGAIVTKVILVAQTDRGMGRATLLVNGHLADNARVDAVGTYGRYELNTNVGENRFDQGLNSLQLELDGNFNVARVVVQTNLVGPVNPAGVSLGTTNLVGNTPVTQTIIVGVNQGRFNRLNLRALSDDFHIDQLDVLFGNGTHQALSNVTIQENNTYSLDLLAQDRAIQSVTIRGRKAVLWGTAARLQVIGIR